jgi:pimeloyl-ACP methyl ester carboxylesterase
LGIGPSAEAYDLRAQALDTPGTAPVRTRPAAPRHAGLARQMVRFCRSSDGVRLAYATSGEGPPLVKASNWMTHLDYDWASPVWSHWWRALSEGRLLVRYDERGCGLSDWAVDASSFTLEAWVRDLEAIVDTLGLERFPLLGVSQGGPIAVTYAARHPERVSHLVIYGTCTRSTWERATPTERRSFAALAELIRGSWGSDQPGFRQVYDARFLPDGPLEMWRAFDELQRRSTSAENAYHLWHAFGHLDASDAARSLDIPTLILHSRGDQAFSFAEAEDLHPLMPGSRLVPLDSPNHILQADEPAFVSFMNEVRTFLAP